MKILENNTNYMKYRSQNKMAESAVEEDEKINSENDLPPGWESRFMTDGRIYYIE